MDAAVHILIAFKFKYKRRNSAKKLNTSISITTQCLKLPVLDWQLHLHKLQYKLYHRSCIRERRQCQPPQAPELQLYRYLRTGALSTCAYCLLCPSSSPHFYLHKIIANKVRQGDVQY